jgi:hypothetical protein
MPLDVEKAATSANASGAGAPDAEIEITPEMIEAGIDRLSSHYFAFCDGESLDQIVRIVFLAMEEARRGSGHKEHQIPR